MTLGNFIYFLQDIRDDEDEASSEKSQKSSNIAENCHNCKTIISSTSEANDGSLASVLHPHADEVFIWCQDPSDFGASRPQFWLILEVAETEVHVYFQYREGQFEATLPWRQALQLITNQVQNLCKKVNQR